MKTVGKKLVKRLESREAEALYVVLLLVFGSMSAYFLGDIVRATAGKPAVKFGQVDLAGAKKEAEKASALLTAKKVTALKKAPTTKTASATVKGKVVASKRGKRYHYPWCSGAKQMSEKNKIWFKDIAAARAAGYTPAQNCKGLH